MRPSIAILITTFNGAEFIGEVLDSIKAYHPSASEIPVYIFDDCSSDQTLEVVRRRQAKVPIHIVQNPRNLGECENVNCAMVRLEGDGIEWAMLLQLLCQSHYRRAGGRADDSAARTHITNTSGR